MSHNEKLKRMIDKNKIEEAARGAADLYEQDLPIMSYEENTEVDGQHHFCQEFGAELFKDGAKWMQEEFLKDLWHQTDEEPQGYDEWILLHYNVGNYYSLAQVKDFKSWKGFVERAPIEKWLYIDDLFPKEGSNHD